MARKSRTPVTRERALHAAVTLADAEGLAALTMRRLASELGVEAMSLYHHLAGKEEILDGMVEVVFAEMELPPQDVGWKAAMLRRGASVRTVLTRHPWAIAIMQSRTAPGPETLGHLDAMIGSCRRAGFSVAMTAHAVSLIDSYVYGFVLQEVNLTFDDGSDMEEMVGEILPGLTHDAYPHLLEFTTKHVLLPGYSYGLEFEFGLELVLDGLHGAATHG